MPCSRTTDGKDILTVLTVEEAEALRDYLAHDYIPFDAKHEPLHQLWRFLDAELDKRAPR